MRPTAASIENTSEELQAGIVREAEISGKLEHPGGLSSFKGNERAGSEIDLRGATAVQSKAVTVDEYLESLPPDRRDAIAAVRRVILENLPKGFDEGMQYGMIGYFVPHRLFPAGYHCDPKQPLPYIGLASQKNYLSLYIMSLYGAFGDSCDPSSPGFGLAEWFNTEWKKTGKKLDMGKSCIRFKKVDDLALDVIAEAIRRMPVEKYIEIYETVLKTQRGKSSSKAKAEAKPKAKRKPAKTK